MSHPDVTYEVELGFTPADQAMVDRERPPLLRARPRAATPYGDDGIEIHRCPAIDWAGAGAGSSGPDLFGFGFDVVDLTEHPVIRAVCARILDNSRISDDDAAALRGALGGARLRCGAGQQLEVLHVADEGLILRTAGPNRLSLVEGHSKGMNGHGPATSVHSDQDVYGTPLRQLMDGRAPELFRHESPDGHNRDAALMLVNLWIPLQQISQPLVLAESASVDRLRHQLRYGLATDDFLDRDEDQAVNDIWTFLHDPGQRWWFRSEMDHRHAYVFNTVSTPHGAGCLSGEDMAERCYLALEAIEAAVEHGDPAELSRAVAAAADLAPPERTTPALRSAIGDMLALLARAEADPAALTGPEGQAWLERSRRTRRRLVRMSVELRMVVSVAP